MDNYLVDLITIPDLEIIRIQFELCMDISFLEMHRELIFRTLDLERIRFVLEDAVTGPTILKGCPQIPEFILENVPGIQKITQ